MCQKKKNKYNQIILFITKKMAKRISYAQLDKYFIKISLKDFDLRFINLYSIGSGGGSVIYTAVDTFNNNRNVAIKMYNNIQMMEENRIDVVRQVQILNYLKQEGHDQVVEIYDAFKVMRSQKISQYCIVIELCERSLHQEVIDEAYEQVPFLEKLKICESLCKLVLFLHSRNIIHRDIKPSNFLVTRRNDQKVYLLADFGQAKSFTFGVENSKLRGTIIFTNPLYMQNRNYTCEPDLFSLALTFVFVLSDGKYLFNITGLRNENKIREQMENQLKNIRKGLDRFDKLTQNTKIFLQKCLNESLKSIEQMRKEIYNLIREETSGKQKIKQNQEKGQSINIKFPQDQNQPGPMMKKQNYTTYSTVPSEQSIIQENVNSFRQLDPQKCETQENQKQLERHDSESINFSLTQSEVTNYQGQHKKDSSSKYNRSFTLNILNQSIVNENDDLNSSRYKIKKSNVNTSFIRQGQNKSIRSSIRLEKFNLMRNSLIAEKWIQTKNQEITQAIKSLSSLEKFKQRLQSFKIIQGEDLQPASAKKLMLICLKHLILEVKNEQASLKNANSLEYYKRYLSDLENSYKKLFQNFKEFHSRSQKTQFVSFLVKKDIQLSEAKYQFKIALEGFNRPLSSRKLSQILK